MRGWHAPVTGVSYGLIVRIPGPLHPARFIARPNRFLTLVELNGNEVEAHLPDPGRLKKLLLPGVKVWIRDAAGPARRTKYTLTLVEAPSGEIVSLVTTFPNEMVAEALAANRIPELEAWTVERREASWGKSRFDFLLRDGAGRQMLLEVKSVTLVEGDRALFPDAITSRGARHVRELAAAVQEGFEAAVLFVVQRRDAGSITAARAIDPAFAEALGEAHTAGVTVLGYRCEVSTEEAWVTEAVPVLLD
jgi:sugar fermentation stimulation protein A